MSACQADAMHAVVIDRIEADPQAAIQAAAQALGVTAFDVRPSMTAEPPAVLTVLADPGHAAATVAALHAAGVQATVRPIDVAPTYVEVRQLELTAAGVRVADRSGTPIDVPYAEIDALIRVISTTVQSSTKEVRERKLSLGRSMMTGGLMNTKVEKKQVTSRQTDSDELLYVFHGAAQPLRLSESEMTYQGLGANLQPSRLANFNFIADELRRNAPHASFDDRLRKGANLGRMLGRTLSPETHLEFAVGLVAGAVRGH